MNEQKAINLLRKYAPDSNSFEKVLLHSQAVQKIALRIAKEIKDAGNMVDIELIRTASLLHDIGRFQCPPGKDDIRHGIAGADILRKEGFPRHALVAERHIGVGISKRDIKKQKLKLPLKDYVPVGKEEKIIAHADNLVFGDREGSLDMVIERFRKELGDEYAKRVKKLAGEIEGWSK